MVLLLLYMACEPPVNVDPGAIIESNIDAKQTARFNYPVLWLTAKFTSLVIVILKSYLLLGY